MNKILSAILILLILSCDNKNDNNDFTNNDFTNNDEKKNSPIIKNLSEKEQHLYLDLKERAHDELKAYTDYWKARIAVNDIAESGNTDSRQVCLTSKNNTCTQQATLTAIVEDVATAPIEGINDNEDSRVDRKALSTSIKWQSRYGADQIIEFYVEQLVMQP